MTFFYDLNKKLDTIREKPELKHGQLNERDMGKHNNGKTTGFKAVADKAAKEYGSKAAGERVAGAVKAKMAKAGKLEEQNMEEGLGDVAKKVGSIAKKVGGAVLDKLGHGSDEDMIRDLQKKAGVPQTGKKPEPAKEGVPESTVMEYDRSLAIPASKALIAALPRMSKLGYTQEDKACVEKFISLLQRGDTHKARRYQKRGGCTIHASNFIDEIISDTNTNPDAEREPVLVDPRLKKQGMAEEGGKPMSDKQKSFAALAEPKDKITFADKIAGAKKEVDEMLGDVAAEAMKAALSPKQKKIDMNKNGKLDANDFAMLRKGGKAREETDEGWDDMMKDVERRRSQTKKGEITHGAKHDIENTGTGRRVTRRVDPNTGYSVGADDDTPADGEKRGRGRPKGSKKAMGAKGPSGKSKLMTKEAGHDSSELKAAAALLKKAGYKITKATDGAEELDEKAVSKKQQRFMGMVHATQKGEKAPSKEVAKVAKSMKKSDAEDFAATKHKGLPEKKKPEAKSDTPKKKKEKTEEAGGTGTPTASSGFGFGKGIYDSMNHELETMIAEGMNISMNMNSDANGGPGKSLTITATDEDALKLSALLKNAGLGGGDDQGYGGEGYKSACGCGTPDCSCGEEEMDEAYGDTQPTLNEPDYPTNTETAEDNFGYSGGVDGPKSTGQSTVPVLASQEERQESYAEAEEDAIKRMMEMAGIKEAKVDEDDVEEGNKFTGNLAKARAAGKKQADLDGDGDMEKVDEGILSATANLWTEYKGKYGV